MCSQGEVPYPAPHIDTIAHRRENVLAIGDHIGMYWVPGNPRLFEYIYTCGMCGSVIAGATKDRAAKEIMEHHHLRCWGRVGKN